MCGLSGLWARQPLPEEHLRQRVQAMTATLRHRGPDEEGVWLEPGAGLALGHRRLSILDLSAQGAQPMASADGRYQLAFNGEIYNYLELRQELEALGHRWRGHADTEVLLAGVVEWGLQATLQRCNGMWAFALWDRHEQELWLSRDRVGKKPLYLGRTRDGALAWGSELAALRACPHLDDALDADAVALFLRHKCVPAPRSILRSVGKLMPGTLLRLTHDDLRAGAVAADLIAAAQPYWSAAAMIREAQQNPYSRPFEEAADHLEELLRSAVGLRMLADVPVGAFLSGGVDSSLVVALMQAQSTQPVRTFTIGFEQADYSEAEHARAVAQHLGTDHRELTVTATEAQAVIPRLAEIYDEPFADSSQIPTFLVSELARQDVTVSLSGDGGDELFAGYNRHGWLPAIWKRFGRAPRSLRGLGAALLRGLSPRAWDRLYAATRPLRSSRGGMVHAGDKLHKLAAVLPCTDPAAMYQRLVSDWNDPLRVVPGAQAPPHGWGWQAGLAEDDLGIAERAMAMDLVGYLPDDILVKVDRAAMAVSLEGRNPLLDHRVVAFAWSLPLSYKRNATASKRVLREVLYRHVPPALIERPKQGFGVPIGSWLRGPLRDWAEELLRPAALETDGLLHAAAVTRLWAEHLSGRRSHEHALWNVLMLQAWRQRWYNPAAKRLPPISCP